MLDTDKWNEYMDGTTKKGYKNATYASYVLGGPTLEMFCESYNKTHGGLDVIPVAKNESNVYYGSGYKVQKGDTLDNWTGDLKASTQTELSTGINNMHFKCLFWIASTTAGNSSSVMLVGANGFLSAYASNSNGISFRPLVCLKSNVHLVEKTNGTTTTYELELD